MDNLKIDPDSEINENYDEALNKGIPYSYFVETLLGCKYSYLYL